MHTVLSIAGSDSSGGAGIQADLKTITCLGEYGMTVITALTAQNTMGVEGVEAVSVQMVRSQMDAVFSDIRPEAVKLGMIVNVPDAVIFPSTSFILTSFFMISTPFSLKSAIFLFILSFRSFSASFFPRFFDSKV